MSYTYVRAHAYTAEAIRNCINLDIGDIEDGIYRMKKLLNDDVGTF